MSFRRTAITLFLIAFALVGEKPQAFGALRFLKSEPNHFDFGDQRTLPPTFGTGEFTFELWIKPDASFPVGLCAERVLLASASSLYPKVPIESLAISYQAGSGDSDHPISPCGICRQSLQEYEMRVKHPIRLILGGMEGKVYVIPKASSLLPLAFTSDELK